MGAGINDLNQCYLSGITMVKAKSIKLNIGQKLLVISLLSLAGMVITLVMFYQGLSSSLLQEKISQTHRLSDAGLSIIKYYYKLD